MKSLDERIQAYQQYTESSHPFLARLAQRNLRILEGKRAEMLLPAPRPKPQPVQATDPAWLSWASLLLLAALCVALFCNRSPEPTWTSGGYDQAVQAEVSE